MTQDTEAGRPPRKFAVYSPTGVHIGLWGDGKIAADVAAESPGNTIEELVAADEYEALHERAEAAERKVLELRAECAMLRLDLALNRDLDQITDEESQDFEGSLRAERDALRDALRDLRKSAALLQQNSEGCVVNHYGEDYATHGMPGWLMDTRASIERAAALTGEAKP